MKLCTFDYVRETNAFAKFGWNPPARGHSIHTYVKYTLLVTFLPAFLPAFLPFFLRTCTGQTDRDNFTHNCSKDAVWRKEVSSQQSVFLSFVRTCDFFQYLMTINLETFQRFSVTKVTCTDNFTF